MAKELTSLRLEWRDYQNKMNVANQPMRNAMIRIEEKMAELKDSLRDLNKNGVPLEQNHDSGKPIVMSKALERLSNFETMIRDYIRDLTDKFTSMLRTFSDKPDFNINDPSLLA